MEGMFGRLVRLCQMWLPVYTRHIEAPLVGCRVVLPLRERVWTRRGAFKRFFKSADDCTVSSELINNYRHECTSLPRSTTKLEKEPSR